MIAVSLILGGMAEGVVKGNYISEDWRNCDRHSAQRTRLWRCLSVAALLSLHRLAVSRQGDEL